MNAIFKMGAIAALGAMPFAAAAEYPEKPVEFVVPFPPGDLEDILTRMIADEFKSMYGVPAAVVNKPGGGGGPFPGAVEIALAPADGYTVGSFVLDVPLIGPDLGIPPLAGNPFEPIGIFLTYPMVIAAGADAPYDTLEDLAAYAQENDVALGHFGDVTTPSRQTFAIAKTLGFEFSSKAAFDALDCNTLASGDADVINTTLQLVMPCIDELKFLTSMTGERISLLPDTPTVGEIIPELDLSSWNGLFVHEDTPADVREKLAVVVETVMASDAAKDLSAQTGALIYWKNATESIELMESDMAVLAKISAAID